MTYVVYFGEQSFKFDSLETMLAAITYAPRQWSVRIHVLGQARLYQILYAGD